MTEKTIVEMKEELKEINVKFLELHTAAEMNGEAFEKLNDTYKKLTAALLLKATEECKKMIAAGKDRLEIIHFYRDNSRAGHQGLKEAKDVVDEMIANHKRGM